MKTGKGGFAEIAADPASVVEVDNNKKRITALENGVPAVPALVEDYVVFEELVQRPSRRKRPNRRQNHQSQDKKTVEKPGIG